MTTRLDLNGPTPSVTSTWTATRTTAPPTRPFQSMLSAGSQAVVGGAEAAVRRLPGGPILAAAFRPLGGAGGGALSPTGGTLHTTPEGYPAATSAASSPGGGDPSLEGMLDQNTDKNLYYIGLQERISAENRLYSAYSNVLRVRHETMKNAIGNFR